MSQEPSNSPSEKKPRRWSVLAAGMLVFALALVVIYTSRPAFTSPLDLVVIASIGLAALLVQLRINKQATRSPIWLNALGLLFAVAAVFADRLHFSTNVMMVAALAAVLCFGISGTAILRNLRKRKS